MSKKCKVLVTGSSGQLGSELRVLAPSYPDIDFLFLYRKNLDLTDYNQVKSYFYLKKFDFVINCAAYTAVDLAESEWIDAMAINAIVPRNLSRACSEHGMKLIHISTDYVFDGKKKSPYEPTDECNPINFYGKTKRRGELMVEEVCKSSFIIRTSWLYSSFGKNFVKTMLGLAKKNKEVKVVNDQVGSPTYAADLAQGIMQIVHENSTQYGLYHFANQGETDWANFARTIFKQTNYDCQVIGIPTSSYPTPAQRSPYSVLDSSLFQEVFQCSIPQWKDSLKKCLKLI